MLTVNGVSLWEQGMEPANVCLSQTMSLQFAADDAGFVDANQKLNKIELSGNKFNYFVLNIQNNQSLS